MRLLADCGNTSVKLALAEGRTVQAFARLKADPAQLSAAIYEHAGAIEELVLLPGNWRNSDVVRTWWAGVCCDLPVRTIGDEILLPVVGQYPGMGVDRIVAGIAACVLERQPVLVVDAGTATTIGAWYHDGRSEPPAGCRFLGGLILPAARTCLAGLAAMAPALPLVEPLGPGSSAAQRSTVAAIGAAMGIGYGPMVAACLIKLSRETGIRTTVFTGGNVDLLVDSQVAHRDRVREQLTMDGLAWLAER